MSKKLLANKRYISFLLLAFIIGIVVQFLADISIEQACCIYFPVLSAVVLLCVFKRRFFFVFFASFFVLGAFLFAINFNIDHSVIKDGEYCSVYGRVCEPPSDKEDHSLYMLDDVHIVYEGEISAFDPCIRLYSDDRGISYGDVVKFDTKLYVPDEVTIPGADSEKVYLALNGIGANVYSDEIDIVSHTDDLYGVFLDVRQALGENIDAAFSEDTAPVAKAMFLGIKDSLSDDVRFVFSAGGMAHILAISGLHIGIIIMLLSAFADKVIKNRNLRYSLLLALPILYAMLTGLPSSVVRVVIMTSFITVNKWLMAERDDLTVLSFAMLLSLIIDPLELFSAGFLLSYAAVFGILCIYPPLRRLIKEKEFPLFTRNIAEILGVSCAAVTPTLPVSAYYFSSISYISPLTSLIAVPLSSVIVVFTMITAFIGFISEAAAVFFAALPQAVIKFLIITGRSLYEAKIGYFDFYGMTVIFSAAVIACCFIMSQYVFIKKRIKIIICACIIAVCACLSFIPAYSDASFKMMFLDCGYGHACVVSENEKDIVITDGSTASFSGIETYFENNRGDICAVVLTHYGDDELRATEDFLSKRSGVSALYCAQTDSEFDEYCKANNVVVQKAEKYDKILLLNDIGINIVESSEDKISFALSRGGEDICYYASHPASELSGSYRKADILKLNGSGSASSLDNVMADMIRPDYCIINADKTSEYAAPEVSVCRLLDIKDIETFRTDIHHTITLSFQQNGTVLVKTLN